MSPRIKREKCAQMTILWKFRDESYLNGITKYGNIRTNNLDLGDGNDGASMDFVCQRVDKGVRWWSKSWDITLLFTLYFQLSRCSPTTNLSLFSLFFFLNGSRFMMV